MTTTAQPAEESAMVVTAPTLTATPAQPGWWECRNTELSGEIAGSTLLGDPADLTDIELEVIVDAAVLSLKTWHQLADTMPTPAWRQLASPDSFSGHKLHIACASFDDVRAVVARVLPVVFRAGLGSKAATSSLGLLRGKGVVVYLPRRDTVARDASLVALALDGYRASRPVDIAGSERLTGDLWWRHEFGGVDPGYDVFSPGEYRSLYVPAPVPA